MDKLQATIRSLKERAAAPLAKSSTNGVETAQGFASPPSADLKTAELRNRNAFAWPRELRAISARADSLAAVARTTGDPSDHDAAASAWSRVHLAATPRSAADLEARCRAADERYAAWSIAATNARTEAARTALSSALELLPAGPRRDHYAGWLALLR